MHESRTEFLTRRAKEMRNAPTKAEWRLKSLLEAPWRSQVPLLGDYIADFLHEGYGLVLEADGGYHQGDQLAKDLARDRAMMATGYQVLRFTNMMIYKQPKWVLECIRVRINTIRTMRGLEPIPIKRGLRYTPIRDQRGPLKVSSHNTIRSDYE